jgi:hypothetical protein
LCTYVQLEEFRLCLWCSPNKVVGGCLYYLRFRAPLHLCVGMSVELEGSVLMCVRCVRVVSECVCV